MKIELLETLNEYIDEVEIKEGIVFILHSENKKWEVPKDATPILYRHLLQCAIEGVNKKTESFIIEQDAAMLTAITLEPEHTAEEFSFENFSLIEAKENALDWVIQRM